MTVALREDVGPRRELQWTYQGFGVAVRRSLFSRRGRLAKGRALRWLLLGVLAIPLAARAIIVRHDVADSAYLVAEKDFPALVDLEQEGHGILIGPSWVVTVAHAAAAVPTNEVTINQRRRRVACVIFHPGYRTLPPELLRGDARPAMEFLRASHDIALIRLTEPVKDVAPAVINRAANERGKSVKIYGKGATGNGQTGQDPGSSNRTTLRRAFNVVTGVDGRWLTYRFDAGKSALALEGMLGNGDSGGPLLIEARGTWLLAGLASWKYWEGRMEDFRAGAYGQVSYHVRVAHYTSWLEEVMTTQGQQQGCSN